MACRAPSVVDCVRLTSEALSAEKVRLSGYEWLSRLDLYEGDLNEYQSRLVAALESGAVQYEQFDWFGAAH